jgi:hypothetical protein
MEEVMFDFPIGIQLFNRPEYAKNMLESLSNQTIPINQEKLFIFIDGFKGSVYEDRGSRDQTSQVKNLAKTIFPFSKVVNFQENLGIASLHLKLQQRTFAGPEEWAVFFEEDVVLDPSYLEEIKKLIEIVNDCDTVVNVACFQILPTITNLSRGYDGFYPGHGTQAFAERKNFFLQKAKMLEAFIEIEKNSDYPIQYSSKKSSMVKDSSRISKLASFYGLGGLINSYNHDLAMNSFLVQNGKLHVVSKPNLATDIGVEGIHHYITPTLEKPKIIKRPDLSIEEKKIEFQNSLASIKFEVDQNAYNNYRMILEGYYTSLSGRAMVAKIVEIFIRKITAAFRKL